jgi:SAM-dependent methyltransferase
MSEEGLHASANEMGNIAAMSRQGVVDAYTVWKSISIAEDTCLGLAFSPGARLLDLGCGAGRFAMRLGSEAGLYLGVDASEEMIGAARRSCPDLTFIVADIVELDADLASWDVILLMGNVLDCLHPESRRARLLARCSMWLRPGGALVGSSHLTKRGQQRGYYSEDYHGAEIVQHRASLGEIVEEVEARGFEVALASRDYRGSFADWSYWVGRLPG